MRTKRGHRGVIDYRYASSSTDTWPVVHAKPASQTDLDGLATHLVGMQIRPPLQLEKISNHDPLSAR
jgi:hypothetical protein